MFFEALCFRLFPAMEITSAVQRFMRQLGCGRVLPRSVGGGCLCRMFLRVPYLFPSQHDVDNSLHNSKNPTWTRIISSTQKPRQHEITQRGQRSKRCPRFREYVEGLSIGSRALRAQPILTLQTLRTAAASAASARPALAIRAVALRPANADLAALEVVTCAARYGEEHHVK